MNDKLTKKQKYIQILINNIKPNYFYLYWNIQPELQMKKYIYVKSNMYLIDSLGGGFASIKNADKAFHYLLLLYKLALTINDQETIIKCMIYYGFTLLWKRKYQEALQVFNQQKELAQKKKYYILVNRCDSGLNKLINL
jgi:Domain of unknown function (DUF4807)